MRSAVSYTSVCNIAHSFKFELISLKMLISLNNVFSAMEHDMHELFCCLARDYNYHDEK